MNDTATWIKNLERYFSELWREKGYSVDSRHGYILTKENWKELLYPTGKEKNRDSDRFNNSILSLPGKL